ncbi:type VI secretion protein [Parashewanella spongiae]|uniref:Type VI secretion protein n=1 Tax=Parashewanella spongiae TaxID=342950 RepID=A0A3A6TGS0_9GAMM|nr:type VI secretion system contractile sheath large subunit [Parashewanella spongiae]MCL1078176.1 type VI secretion system contractile sheath large subunit [Parashewanella spongiae]RJY14889.1 type VI secretion protein [Parashewanella spongiae]
MINDLPFLAPFWLKLNECAQAQDHTRFHATLVKLIALLDNTISSQLSSVIQDQNFKRLEASWLGLESLVQLPVSQRRVKIKVLDFDWNSISADLNLSFDIKYTSLFRKIYSKELDTAGGTPYGLLVVDHKVNPEFVDDCDYDDLYTLQLLSELGEKALCPVLLGVDEYFFGDDPNRLLHDGKRISRILESNDYRSWSLLREKLSSRFLHLVLPEYYLRGPYRNHTAGFVFNESNTNTNALWGNSPYLMAINVIREFDRISWFGFLRSYNQTGHYGAIVDQEFQTPTKAKVDIFSEEDGFWSEKGFIPLTSLYLTEQKGFFSNQSVWKSPTEADRVLGMLQTNLMACRFGHYIKAQTRDQVGGYDSVNDCKRSLERWLQQYISELDYGEDSVMARYPLKSSEVLMKVDPADQTRYLCQITLQPQYQYEILDAQVVLSTSLSSKEVGESL